MQGIKHPHDDPGHAVAGGPGDDHLARGGVPAARGDRLERQPGPDGRLTRRRFEGHLTHLPLSYAVLRAGDAQLAHAPVDRATRCRGRSTRG